MKLKAQKYILLVAGIIATIVGIVFAIPSFLKENYIAAILSTILLVAGIILIAIAFGEDDHENKY